MIKSKKFKHIKHHSQLVTGQLYVRLVINMYGEFWYTIYKLIGKPFTVLDVDGENSWMVNLKSVYSSDDDLELVQGKFYVGDMIGWHGEGFKEDTGPFEMKLIPFSNALISYIEASMGSLENFFYALNGNYTIPPDYFEKMVKQHAREKRMDIGLQDFLDANLQASRTTEVSVFD